MENVGLLTLKLVLNLSLHHTSKQYLLDDYPDLPRDIRAILLSLNLPVTILHLLDPVSVRLAVQQLLLGCSNHLLLLRHPAGQL